MATDKNFVIKNGLTINGSEIITSAGNLTNIGTISAAAITTTAANQDINMDASANGQLEIDGNGYQGAIALGSTTMAIYHNSSSRDLTLGTNETARITIGGTGGVSFNNNNLTSVGTISSGAISTTGNLDVDGIIDNTRNNTSVSAPSTSDHTLGTRIKFYDSSATSFYAIGIESNTMWFNSDQGYKWYEDAVERMTLSSGGNLSIDGSLNIGAAIGSRATTLSIEGDSNSSPLAVKCSGTSTVFSVLPWSGAETYLASGAYYDDGSWVHASSDTTSCLFTIDGSGVSWYSSNNSSSSWNVASNVNLWNSSGNWVGGIASSGYNNSNWDTAYGWGDHASAGYLTTTGTAANSQLLDNIDSTGFFRNTANIGSTDVNNLTTRGVYGNSNESSNQPYDNNAGTIIHLDGRDTSYKSQMFQYSANGALYLRGKHGSSNSWSSWFQVYDENHKPTYSELGTMAYSNLTGTPTIPTNNNQLTNGAGYITDITTQTDPKYLRSDANDTFTGTLTTGELQIFSSHPVHTGYSGIANTEAWTTTTEQYMIISAGTDTYINGDSVYIRAGNNSSTNQMVISTSGTTIGGNTVWHAGNDGSGSTLDADRLDGSEGAVYFKSPSDVSGWQNTNSNFSVRGGNSSAVGLHMEQSDGDFGFQIYGDGTNYGFLDGEWANWDIKKTANGAFSVDEGAGLKRVLNEANWSSYVTSVSGTSGGLSGSPNITVGTITSGTVDSSGTSNFDSIQLTDASRLGFGTVKSGATVGHTASVDEGIFWHTTNDYGIFRTAGGWSSPNYQQLKLKWHTGIEIDGHGTSYGKSGINFLNGNIKMDGTQILDSSRNLRNIPLQNLGSTQAGSEHAVINIGRVGGAGETRAIDIIGSWSGGESKSITAVHGSSSTQIVGQINFIHDSPGSRMRFGKLYESGDSSVYPMILDGSSLTGASLDVTNDQHSTGNANRTFGTAASRKKKGAFHVKGGQGGTNGNAYVTGITFPGASEDETQAGLYCSQNSSTGTSLSLMCTNSYANGPKEYFTVLDSGYCKVMSNTLDVYDQVYANTKGSAYLILGEDAYSTSTAYIGLKTSFQSGANDYMILSGVSDGDTYISAKNGGAVNIRGGGNYSSNQISVPDGSTITATTTDFRCTGNVTAYASDARLKTNIQTIENPIEKVQQIRGVTFDWIDGIEDKGFHPLHKAETGVIAQDIQKVISDAAVPAPFDEEYLTVQHEKIIPLLIEAIKEQQKQIEELKEEVSSLRSKN